MVIELIIENLIKWSRKKFQKKKRSSKKGGQPMRFVCILKGDLEALIVSDCNFLTSTQRCYSLASHY